VTPLEIVLGLLAGFVAGILSGAFGVGGGIITTPAISILLGGSAIVAVATPLPVIFPTALVGAYTYSKADEVSFRAAKWAVGPGAVGAILGALLTEVVNAHLLLIVTAVLLAVQAVRVIRGGGYEIRPRGTTPGMSYAIAGFAAGFVSGLLGVGGGIIMVPILTTILGMPLKRALGTSLVVISAIVVPGTIVHALLGHIDWAIFFVLTVGVVPGARIGATLALRAKDRTLRLAVGVFLFAVAILYAVEEISALAAGKAG
jgi:uncharacterized membrane protein YfcA